MVVADETHRFDDGDEIRVVRTGERMHVRVVEGTTHEMTDDELGYLPPAA